MNNAVISTLSTYDKDEAKYVNLILDPSLASSTVKVTLEQIIVVSPWFVRLPREHEVMGSIQIASSSFSEVSNCDAISRS